MSTRSSFLGSDTSTLAKSTTVLYTCPEGFAAIVKDLLITNGTAAAVFVWVGAVPVNGLGNGYLWYGNLEPGTFRDLSTWCVMETGFQLLFYAGAAGVTAYASGTVLPG